MSTIEQTLALPLRRNINSLQFGFGSAVAALGIFLAIMRLAAIV